MGAISKETVIAVPPDTVFNYVADPRNAPNFISSILRIISGPSGTGNQGDVWQAEANFLGRRSTVALRLSDLVQNEMVRFAIEGEPKATLSMRLNTRDGGASTLVALQLEVPSVPDIFLNALMGKLFTDDMSRLKGVLEQRV